MRRLRPEPALAAAAAGCALLVVVVPAASPVRAVAGIGIVLVLPAVAFPRLVLQGQERGPERLLVGLGASVAVVVAAALGLYLIGVRLDSTSWALILACLTILAAAIGWRRGGARQWRIPRWRRPRRSDARFKEDALPSFSWGSTVTPGAIFLVAISLALIAAALVVATLPLPAPGGTTGSTAVWLQANGPRHVVAVARSGEATTSRYRMTVAVAGTTVTRSREFVLSPGQQQRLRVPPPLPPRGPVEAKLYRLYARGHRLAGRTQLTLGGVPALDHVSAELRRARTTPTAVLSAVGVPHIAAQTGARLRRQGFLVIAVADAPRPHRQSQVLYSPGHDRAAKALARFLGIPGTAPLDAATRSVAPAARLAVVLGGDRR